MPNIREYNAPNIALRPSETGAEAWNRAGMRIQEDYHQAAGARQEAFNVFAREMGASGQGVAQGIEIAQRQAAQHELTQGAAAGSAAFADLTQKWNDTASHTDPNDMGTARQKFMDETFTPAMEKFSGAFHTPRGQEWAAEHTAAMTQHFNEHTIADVSLAAGQSLLVNVKQTADNLAVAVRNDPSALGTAIGMVDGAIGGLVDHAHGLSAEDAIKAKTSIPQDIKRQVVRAAISGLIEKNPAAGKAMLANGQYASYMNQSDQEELAHRVTEAERANRSDAMMAQAAADRAERKASEAKASATLSAMAVKGADGQFTGEVSVPQGAFSQVLRDPTIKAPEKVALFDFMRGVTNSQNAAHNDSATAADLEGRMADERNPTSVAEITAAVKGKKLTPEFGMTLIGKTNPQGPAVRNDPGMAADLTARLGATENPTTVEDVATAVAKRQITAEMGLQLHSKITAAAPAVRNDAATSADLLSRLGDPAHPTTQAEVSAAVADKKITPEFGMNIFGKATQEAKTAMSSVTNDPVLKGELDRATARIAGPNLLAASGGTNQAVRDRTDQFKADTLRILQDAVMNHQDVKQFLDPKSPQYLFTEERIAQYRPTKQELQNQLVGPRQAPGSSAATPAAARPDLGEIMRKALSFPAKPADKSGFN